MTAKTAIIPTMAITSPIKVELPGEFAFDESGVCALTVRINVEMQSKTAKAAMVFLIFATAYWLFLRPFKSFGSLIYRC